MCSYLLYFLLAWSWWPKTFAQYRSLKVSVQFPTTSSGARGCDRGGVCAADACGVGPSGAADRERAATAGGAGGGAGVPGAGPQPGRPRHRRPPAAVHTPGLAPILCECNLPLFHHLCNVFK